MANENGGIATGALLILVGVFLVSRTLAHDDHGYNLVDRLLAIFGTGKQNVTGSKTQVVGKLTANTVGTLLSHPLPPILTGNPLHGSLLDPFGPAGQLVKGVRKPDGTVVSVK
jgi:hypothetical protein